MGGFARAALFSVLTLVGWRAHAQTTSVELAAPSVLKLPDGPGSVQGLADSVSAKPSSGQLEYSVPISVPTAGGHSPALALEYSGALGNGPVGVGWTLPVPCIRRSLRHGVPTYTPADELVLDGIGEGGRLVLVPDGQYAGEYRVEGMGNLYRIRQDGYHFEVRDPDGVTYLLGTTSESRLGEAGKTAVWFADWVENTAQEVVELHYLRHEDEVYLSEVEWGPEGEEDGSRVFRTLLEYEGRRDPVISFRTGFKTTTGLLLRYLKVESFGEVLTRYELNYDDNPDAHYGYDANAEFPISRLVGVRATGRGGDGEWPALQFHYARPEGTQTVRVKGTDGWILNTRGVTIADVDGDGASDLVRLEMGGHTYLKNQGDRFGPARGIAGASGVDSRSSRFVDLDGDSRAELVRLVDDTWRAYRLEGEKWQRLGEWPGSLGLPIDESTSALVDINGDGRIDLLRATAGGLLMNLNSAAGFAAEEARPPISLFDQLVEPGAPSTRFFDVNGDGLADALWLTDEWMKVFLGRGDGTFEPFTRMFYPWGGAISDTRELLLCDLNRDGLMDLVRLVAGHVQWYPGIGTHSFARTARFVKRPEEAEADVVVSIADLNGNGSEDVVWSSPRGMWAMDLAGSTTAGMLVGIDNGLGKLIAVEYKASATLSMAADGTSEQWEYKLPVSIPVPVRLEEWPGAGQPRVVQYGVRDGFWDGVERRFAGFLVERQLIGRGTTSQRFEETRYHAGIGDSRVLRGKPWYHRIEKGKDRVHTVVETDWQAAVIASLGTSSPLLRRAVQLAERKYLFENETTAKRTLTEYSYDSEARPIKETHRGRLDLDGDEFLLLRAFASDETYWVRDRVYQETLAKLDGTMVSERHTRFGGPFPEEPAAPGVIGRGWPRQMYGILVEQDGSSREVLLEDTVYDAKQNPVEVFSEGVRRWLGYDEQGLFPTSETVRATDDEAPLVWTTTWDKVMGKPQMLEDPNGWYVLAFYDSLGRLEEVAQMGIPHIWYEYAWDASRPNKTTTWVFDSIGLATFHPPGLYWRRTVAVSNGAGEELYSATELGDSKWIIAGFKQRDERGRVTFVADPFCFDGTEAELPEDLPASASTCAGEEPRPITGQSLAYDALDRVVSQTLPTGAKKVVEYSAFSLTVSADDLAPVTSYLDGLARVTRTERTVPAPAIPAIPTDSAPDPSPGVVESVDATYDVAGRIVAMQLQKGAANEVKHEFQYDTLGRLVWARDPDIGERVLTYSDQGWLESHTNGAGQTVSFEYDHLGR
ncbi:MAG: FG-GAP-like repeat-containing protein, partial [Pseudomonadota bacterium]